MINTFDPQNINKEKESIINALWKNKKHFSEIIAKECKTALLLMDWISTVFECRMKNETLWTIETKFPEVLLFIIIKL
jgi:hypothetical protein